MYLYVFINLFIYVLETIWKVKRLLTMKSLRKSHYILCLWGLYLLLKAKKESFKMELKNSLMSVFISDKDTAKVYVQFFEPNNPK